MAAKTAKIEMTRSCYVNGVVREVGDVVDVDTGTAAYLVGIKKAVYIEDQAPEKATGRAAKSSKN